VRLGQIIGLIGHNRRHQEVGRERNAASGGDLSNKVPPTPSYVVVMGPAVHPVTLQGEPSCTCGLGEGCPAAKVLDELSMSAHAHINLPLRETCQGSNLADDARRALGHHLPMPKNGRDEDRADTRNPIAVEYGKRLRLIREAMGYTVRALARTVLSISDEADDVKRAETQLSKWELGYLEVSPSFITKLREQFGIDHNYIYSGSMAGLPDDLRRKLVEKMRDPS
jgi:transcriptional regulator with XRE-family HTH domain